VKQTFLCVRAVSYGVHRHRDDTANVRDGSLPDEVMSHGFGERALRPSPLRNQIFLEAVIESVWSGANTLE